MVLMTTLLISWIPHLHARTPTASSHLRDPITPPVSREVVAHAMHDLHLLALCRCRSTGTRGSGRRLAAATAFLTFLTEVVVGTCATLRTAGTRSRGRGAPATARWTLAAVVFVTVTSCTAGAGILDGWEILLGYELRLTAATAWRTLATVVFVTVTSFTVGACILDGWEIFLGYVLRLTAATAFFTFLTEVVVFFTFATMITVLTIRRLRGTTATSCFTTVTVRIPRATRLTMLTAATCVRLIVGWMESEGCGHSRW